MHAILTFRHLTFIKSTFMLAYALTSLNCISYTHTLLARGTVTSKRSAHRGKHPLTKLNPSLPLHHLHLSSSPSFPHRLQLSFGWQGYLGWLITCQPGSQDPETVPAQTMVDILQYFF